MGKSLPLTCEDLSLTPRPHVKLLASVVTVLPAVARWAAHSGDTLMLSDAQKLTSQPANLVYSV